MGDPLEAAYIAVERAYGEGRFAAALEQAQALQPQLQAGRSDQLELRLQLLIGHIHLYGLQQPSQAAAAYGLVLEQSSGTTYEALASQGLELCQQQRQQAAPPATAPIHTVAEPSAPGAELPATPWLQQLSDPERALQDIQTAWSTAVPTPHRSTAARLALNPAAAAEPSGEIPPPFTPAPSTNDAIGSSSTTDVLDEPPTAPEPETQEEPSPALALVPDERSFSPEDWAEHARGLLLVELSSSSSQPGAGR